MSRVIIASTFHMDTYRLYITVLVEHQKYKLQSHRHWKITFMCYQLQFSFWFHKIC